MSYRTKKRKEQRKRSEERRVYWISIRNQNTRLAFDLWKQSYVSPFAKSSLAGKDHPS